jgi:phosphate acetyltransferase
MKLKSIYILPFNKESQEIIVSIGLISFLKSKYKKVAIFNPVKDIDTHSINKNITTYCFTKEEIEELLSKNKYNEILEIIITKFKKLEEEYDFIQIIGFDKFKIELPFDLNLQIAKTLNSSIIAVLNGLNKSKQHIENELNIAIASINKANANYLGLFINNTNYKIDNCIATIPTIKDLTIPTLHELYNQTDCKKIYGNNKNLNRKIHNIKISAMRLEHFLTKIKDDDLIVVPSDRTDIILACALSLKAKKFPNISGIVLTGNFALDNIVIDIINSLEESNLVILQLNDDTYESVRKIQSIKATIQETSYSKIAQIIGQFNLHTNFYIIEEKLLSNNSNIITPIMFEYMLFKQAIFEKKHIVLPEPNDDRILRASDILLHREVVDITLLGDKDELTHRAKILGLDISSATIINPLKDSMLQDFSTKFYNMRKHKGVTKEIAKNILSTDYNYFATMLVSENIVDGMVSGSISTTANTIRPALQIIKTKKDIDIVSSLFFMCMDTKVIIFADCAINQNPSKDDLVQIAISSANTAKGFEISPKIALLSYATGDSSQGDDVQKIKKVLNTIKEKDLNITVEGPIQYDAAVNKQIAAKKLPNSKIAGNANVLIFPNLNAGNNAYKAVQQSSGAIAIGPILQGLNRPINDLSRGSSVTDIVNTVLITAIQAQSKE